MAHPNVTKAIETIHNPAEPRHFMRVKPVPRRVCIRRKGQILVDTQRAVRVMEVATDVLDPVFYVPREDVRIPLAPIEGKTSHCPLKGDASYFASDEGETLAWTYDAPLDFAAAIQGLVAFYPNEVITEEIGPNG